MQFLKVWNKVLLWMSLGTLVCPLKWPCITCHVVFTQQHTQSVSPSLGSVHVRKLNAHQYRRFPFTCFLCIPNPQAHVWSCSISFQVMHILTYKCLISYLIFFFAQTFFSGVFYESSGLLLHYRRGHYIGDYIIMPDGEGSSFKI